MNPVCRTPPPSLASPPLDFPDLTILTIHPSPNHSIYPSVRTTAVTALREPLCFSVPPPLPSPAPRRRRPTRAVILHLSSNPIPLPAARPPSATAELLRARPMPVITSSSLDDGEKGVCREVEVLINQLAATRANRSRHTLRHAYRLTVDQSTEAPLLPAPPPASHSGGLRSSSTLCPPAC